MIVARPARMVDVEHPLVEVAGRLGLIFFGAAQMKRAGPAVLAQHEAGCPIEVGGLKFLMLASMLMAL